MKKLIRIKDKIIGDGKITVQSMTNTKTYDTESTDRQIKELISAGADFVRVSIPDIESAKAIKLLSKNSVPLIGDIHFSYEPALIAIENGISKIRVNPSNISNEGLRKIVEKCKEYDVPIRVGVNKGSVKRSVTPEELAYLALDSAKRIEDLGWDKLVLAVKTSDVAETVKAYRKLNEITDYPLHVGLTEAGTEKFGYLKSAIAIGSLLLDGIGDTVRVSLTGNPVKEIYAAKNLLRAAGIDKNFVEVISCPTCARTEINVEELANIIQKETENVKKQLKIAVMGCVVNGIGEGKNADFGVAGGKDKSIIFKNGEVLKTVNSDEITREILKLTEEYLND